MIPRAFNKYTELHTINSWNELWGMNAIQPSYLPENNFIIDDIIFASLYKTDSMICYFENVISNKIQPSAVRREALGILGDHIFAFAKDLGFKIVLGWTNNKSVADTSFSHGMEITPYNYATMIKIL